MDGYHGKIGRIRIDFIRGKFKIQNLLLSNQDPQAGIDTLVITCPEIEVDLQIGPLFRKSFEGTVIIKSPELIYGKILNTEKSNSKDLPKDKTISSALPSALKVALEKMPSFNLRILLTQGKVRYLDHTSTPKINVEIEHVNVDITDFSNAPTSIAIPTKANMRATVYEGSFTLAMALRPLEHYLTFDLTSALKDANMVLLNDFFRAYAKIDVNRGTFGMTTEVSAKDGSFKGYVTPFLKDIDIIGAEDQNDSLFRKIWERMVAAVVQGLENNKSDQIATKIEIEGRLDDPHVNILSAIGGILRNAFIRAIQPSLQNTFRLRLRSVVKSAVSGTADFIKNALR